MSDRDWRKSAYLTLSNWPECIPWTGPKRRYGPFPWGEVDHYDPHNLDDYPHHHPAAASVGDSYIGDVCPYCGVPLDFGDEVVLHDGQRGVFAELNDLDDPVPAYHPTCWRERQAEKHSLTNTTLGDFNRGEEA